jgi:hypothetical protein
METAVAGYHVYRSDLGGHFARLTRMPIPGTSFSDPEGSGAANYMVRAVKLETSASGTYFNPSQGTFLVPANPNPEGPAFVAAPSHPFRPVAQMSY